MTPLGARHHRPRRVALAAVCVLVAVLAAGAAPASAGAPPPVTPVVTMGIGSAPGQSIYKNCDGDDELYNVEGAFLLERTGSLLTALTVSLSFTGDYVDGLEDVPSTVTFDAGESGASVVVVPTRPGPGSLVASVVDGADYDVGDPASIDISAPAPQVAFDCSAVFPLGQPELADQTIRVGEKPESLGLPFVRHGAAKGSRDAPSPDQVFTEVQGSLPPGLTYEEDLWGGAATTPGEYRFGVSECLLPPSFAPITVCPGTVPVRIVVLPTEDIPPPTSPPATPVPTEADFTG